MRSTKATANNLASVVTLAVVLACAAAFFLAGCQAQRSMHCESDVTGTTAHAECTATEAGEVEKP